MLYNCSLCSDKVESRRNYIAHLKVHVKLGNLKFPFNCFFGGCMRKFVNLVEYNRHLREMHEIISNDMLSFACTPAINILDQNIIDECMDCGNNDDDENNENNHPSVDSPSSEPNYDRLKKGFLDYDSINRAAFVLFSNIKTSHQISERALEYIINLFNNFYEKLILYIQSKAVEMLCDNIFTNNAVEFLSLCQSIQKPFDFINSIYKQFELIKKSGKYVAPESVNLGTRIDTCLKGDHSLLKHKNVSFEYVSIVETLKTVLSNEEIKKAHEEFELKNDSSYFLNHPIFKDKKNMRVILYFDELELQNPIGDVATIYEAGMFYFALGNLTLRHNSSLNNIYLIAIALMDDLKTYGSETLMRKITDEIKFLETQGFTIDNKHYLGTIAQHCGDNKGMHMIFGLKMGFRGDNICHICNASSKDFINCGSESAFSKITKETYAENILNGVYTPCLLNETQFYHTTENYAFDITHDLWEGIIPLELKLIINGLISENYFDIKFLNARIASFNYSSIDASNKPNLIIVNIDKSLKLKNKAAKFSCLFRLLSFIIGDKVPLHDKYWELYLILSQIVDIIYSRDISEIQTNQLDWLIQDHHYKYLTLFPNETLKKKHHNMIHYGSAIRKLGNLLEYATLRFEGKHSYFKTAHKVSHNNINVPKTIAKSHQIYNCLNLLSQNQLKDRIEIIKGYECCFSQLKSTYRKCLSILQQFKPEDKLNIAKEIKFYGLVYRENMVVTVNSDIGVSSFYKIQNIIVFKVKLIFNFKLIYQKYIKRFF